MNTRPLLLSHAPASPMNPTVRYLFEKYFTVEEYRSDQSYNPASTLIVAPCWNSADWCFQLYEQGFRVAIDNLWEPINRYQAWHCNQTWDSARMHVMHNINWFWYHESLRSVHTGFQYTPLPSYERLALMPMRKQANHRTRLHKAMQPWLDDCYWSYLEQGHGLPNDQDTTDCSTQRYVNTDWYDHTCFSLVAETYDDAVISKEFGETRQQYCGPWPFVTEKTFKPIQYQHPFMIYGQQHTLKFLHDLGFETFENLFDESYDNINSDTIQGDEYDSKLQMIINNVKNFSKQPRDLLTQEKIRHNHAHFTNQSLVESKFINEIVHPLLEFVQ